MSAQQGAPTDDPNVAPLSLVFDGKIWHDIQGRWRQPARSADEPYDKTKRVLRAEIDEAAWASLYSTTSRPFARPATGKIASKVINHFGDEVLKVFNVRGRHLLLPQAGRVRKSC